jgi:hypothetical protein
MTTEGVMAGLLVSRTTFSGHLRSDLIRMAALFEDLRLIGKSLRGAPAEASRLSTEDQQAPRRQRQNIWR